MSENKTQMIDTIPPELRERIEGRPVVSVSFGAGPACVAGDSHRYDPPASLEEGMAWLDNAPDAMRAGHVTFADGTGIWVDRQGFTRYHEPKSEDPRPGIVIRHNTTTEDE